MTSTDAGDAAGPTPTPPFAGLWRRVAAFVVDVLLLGGVGVLLGVLAFDALAALGGWGRLLGFAVAWPYLGLMNSRIGGGQTLGKRLLGLRTVGLDGALLSPAAGLLRGAVVALPWFLNGALVYPDLLQWLPLLMLLSLIVFAVGLGLGYLLVFNRPSRRSLHDWAAKSVVVGAPLPVGAVAVGPVWRGHVVVLGVLALLSLALPVWLHSQQGGDGDVAVMTALRATVVAQPGVRQAGVIKGWSSVRSTQGASTTTYFAVQAWADAPVADEALCRQIGRALLARHAAEIERVDQLTVVVLYGYDIGIASAARSWRVTLSPAQWLQGAAP